MVGCLAWSAAQSHIRAARSKSGCRFFADIFLNLLVDKVAPELLVLDCAAEAGTGPSRPIHDAPTPGPQRAGNFKIW